MYIEGPSFWGLERIYWKQETVKRSQRTTSGRGGRGVSVLLVGDPTKMTTFGYESLQI